MTFCFLKFLNSFTAAHPNSLIEHLFYVPVYQNPPKRSLRRSILISVHDIGETPFCAFFIQIILVSCSHVSNSLVATVVTIVIMAVVIDNFVYKIVSRIDSWFITV